MNVHISHLTLEILEQQKNTYPRSTVLHTCTIFKFKTRVLIQGRGKTIPFKSNFETLQKIRGE